MINCLLKLNPPTNPTVLGYLKPPYQGDLSYLMILIPKQVKFFVFINMTVQEQLSTVTHLCCGSCLISLTVCPGVWTDTATCGGCCCGNGGGGGGGGGGCCWWWYICCICCLAGLLCSSPSLSATVTHDMTFFRCLADIPLDGVDWELQYIQQEYPYVKLYYA